MPELPEVETITRNLAPQLLGREVLSVSLLWHKTLAAPATEAELRQMLQGQRITSLSRRAKYLHLELGLYHLFIHLRMSGDLSLRPTEKPPAPHDRALFHLSGEETLAFNDPRKFGRIWLTLHPQDITSRLGPEPLSPAFTARQLHQSLSQKQRQMKPLLLDQSFLAGLGNIYTDESLHLAGIHPARLSNTISPEQAQRLHAAIQTVLQTGIAQNGASIDWVYRGGNFQNHFRAYQRTGEPCPVCGTAIQRTVIGQRSTHFCPNCQPLP